MTYLDPGPASGVYLMSSVPLAAEDELVVAVGPCEIDVALAGEEPGDVEPGLHLDDSR
jgi:hypothetical protein